MKKNVLEILAIIAAIVYPVLIFASSAPVEEKKELIFKQAYTIRVPFIENKGQIDNEDIQFYAKTFGGAIFVDKKGILTYNLPAEKNKGVVIKEIFTDKELKVEGLDQAPTNVNYFKGKDNSKWKTNLQSYNHITLGEVYKGIAIDLEVHGNNVEKRFTVIPNENPEQIKIQIAGCNELKVNEKGELEVITGLGAVKFTKPVAFQEVNGEKRYVDIAYAILPNNTYSFRADNYDKLQPLIIDPLLASTFIGGSLGEGIDCIAIDKNGNVFVAGNTNSSNYPISPGVYDENHNGNRTAFISKFDNNLSTLLASTFFGGSNGDDFFSLAIDGYGNVFVAGEAYSSDLPTTSGAYDETLNGSCDAFISKFNNDLSALLGSTYIGGSNGDGDPRMAFDENWNLYITGHTYSSDFPATPGAYDTSFNGSEEVYVSKFNNNLTTLLASTFVGGSNMDGGESIAVSESGDIFITGWTRSSDYPTTSGAYDETHNGGYDFYISKMNSDLKTLLNSTFVGGSNDEHCYSIAFNGNVYIFGASFSSDYPTTTGAYDGSFNAVKDVVVSKLDSNLSELLASTFVGGSGYESGEDSNSQIVIDGGGNIFIVGETSSPDYPTADDAPDEILNGPTDAFVGKINGELNILLASTFIGGNDYDDSGAIALDQNGNVFIAGCTCSNDFPITLDAYDESFNGSEDAFVVKFDNNLSGTAIDWDNDGLLNAIENDPSSCTNANDADSDDDGIIDGFEDANQNGIVNDGETDPCKIDTDGDGIQDGTELGYTSGHADTDAGIFQPDFDPDTTTNPLKSDTDGDGLTDGAEDINHNGRVDVGETDPNPRRAMPWIPLLLLD